MASSSESSASVSKSSSVVSLPDAGNHLTTATQDDQGLEEQPKTKSPRLNESSNSEENESQGFKFSEAPSLERLRHLQSEFIDERNWHQWQTPRNLLLALVGEVGELSEILWVEIYFTGTGQFKDWPLVIFLFSQWKGEVPVGLPDWSDKDKDHLGQEMADVLIYLIRLADQCHIDLPAAALNKMAMNRLKYPADKFFGSSRKYNAPWLFFSLFFAE